MLEKVAFEQAVVERMVALYCRKEHRTHGLCDECAELLTYARQRSVGCPVKENKSFCSNCKIHCYSPVMREKIRAVMRFSGPRMLLYHPVLAIKHLWVTLRSSRGRA